MRFINIPATPALIPFQREIQEIFTCTCACHRKPPEATSALHTLGPRGTSYYNHMCLENLYAHSPVHHPINTTQDITALRPAYFTRDFLGMAAFRRLVKEGVVHPERPLLSPAEGGGGAAAAAAGAAEADEATPLLDLPVPAYYEAIANGATPLDFANLLLEPLGPDDNRPEEERVLVCPVLCPDGQTRNLHTVYNELGAGKRYPHYYFLFNGATTRLLKAIWANAPLLWPGDARAAWRAAGENIYRRHYHSKEQIRWYLETIDNKHPECSTMLGVPLPSRTRNCLITTFVSSAAAIAFGGVVLFGGCILAMTEDALWVPCCITGGGLCVGGGAGIGASYLVNQTIGKSAAATLDDIYSNFIIIRPAEIMAQQPRRLSAV